MDGELERKTYTVEEAGRILEIGRSASYGAAASGELPVVRIGKRLLVPRAALDRLLAKEAPGPATSSEPREVDPMLDGDGVGTPPSGGVVTRR